MTANCGTTIFGITTNDGITIGADSMARHPDGQMEIFRKLHVVGDSVIACEGLGILNLPEKTEGSDSVLYRADQWMAEIEADPRIELNANAMTIVNFIETTHPFIELIRREEIIREFYKFQCDSKKGYLADFLVASAFHEEMLVIRKRIRMTLTSHTNGPEWNIVFDGTTYPDRDSPINPFIRYGAGKMGQIDKAFSGDGDCYHKMFVLTNGSFSKLRDGGKVSLDELRNTVRSAISLEAKANPKQVGPPFVVATLQPGKPVSVTSYSE
jgi:hypothetical protein